MSMAPKPGHLGEVYARQFTDPAVVAAYPFRLPYPAETFSILERLIVPGNRTVLDAGCGTGDLARRLASLVERIDAVDISGRMITLGRLLPGGSAGNLRWIQGSIEEAPLDPPYGLITAGESLHWTEWNISLPRLGQALAPGGVLALVGRRDLPEALNGRVIDLVQQVSTNREFQPYNLVDELVSRGLFEPLGRAESAPEEFSQTIDEYIESWHSRNGLSRNRLPAEAATRFDSGVRQIAESFASDGKLQLSVSALVIWGHPLSGH